MHFKKLSAKTLSMKTDYTLSDFDYPLDESLIALHPAEPREAARLLTWPDANTNLTFENLPELLEEGDLLVLNNSKVIPARLKATRPRVEQEGVIEFEILLHRPVDGFKTWEVFAHPAKRMKEGNIIDFDGGVQAKVIGRAKEQVIIEFLLEEDKVFDFFEAHGEMPLPPYIEREGGAEEVDKEDYQTVFAQEKGSVAAPTAGLHFSEELLEKLKAKGVNIAYVTLHVGAGTFQTVKAENLDEHNMHSEWAHIPQDVVDAIKATKAAGKSVIPVGTTALRSVESAAWKNGGEVAPFTGETDIFIRPGYDFKVADKLITNFHLPKSTLLMLVAAFIGFEEMHDLYKVVLKERFKLFSYGDGCLLEKK